jgi:dCMP deaminase
MHLAIEAARRSTCHKKMVGCVVTDVNGRIVSTGYNGSPAGMRHCVDDGCLIDGNGDCVNTVHAEINALLHASNRGYIMWLTDQPCLPCLHAAITAEIDTIVYMRPSAKSDRDLFVSHHGAQEYMRHIAEWSGITEQEYAELQEVIRCLTASS